VGVRVGVRVRVAFAGMCPCLPTPVSSRDSDVRLPSLMPWCSSTLSAYANVSASVRSLQRYMRLSGGIKQAVDIIDVVTAERSARFLMRPPMPWLVSSGVDVLAVLFTVALLSSWLSWRCVRCTARRWCCRARA
jgi:hypothetical protein